MELNRTLQGISSSSAVPCEPEMSTTFETFETSSTTSGRPATSNSGELTTSAEVTSETTQTTTEATISTEETMTTSTSSTLLISTGSTSNTDVVSTTSNSEVVSTGSTRNSEVVSTGRTSDIQQISTESINSNAETSSESQSSVLITTIKNKGGKSVTSDATTSSIVTTGYTESTALAKTSSCSCTCDSTSYIIKTDEEMQEFIRLVKKKLILEKSLLTSYIIRKISAGDNRTSSKVMGTVGAAVIVVIIGSILAIDVHNIFIRR